jgi:hypothetical protein
MKTLIKTMLAAAFLALPLEAWATGDLGCEIRDRNIRFDFNTLINRGTGLFLGGETRFQTERLEVVPALRKLDQTRLQLVHSWYEGSEIRLFFYAEHQDDQVEFASIRLTILTTTDANDDFVGTYTLAVDGPQPIVLRGKTSCLVG